MAPGEDLDSIDSVTNKYTYAMSEVKTEAGVAVKTAPTEVAPAPLTKNVKVIRVGDVASFDAEEQKQMIRTHIRAKVLKQFNIAEVGNFEIPSGGLFMNEIRTNMKLPKVHRKADGGFAENLEQYYERAKPFIRVWLLESTHNANVTAEIIRKVGENSIA